MKQINHGFMEYYYLNEDGTIYNSSSGLIIEPTKHSFRLRNKENRTIYITLRELYKLVYNKLFVIDQIFDLQDQEWKPIENTNNFLFISNKGRIKSYYHYQAKLLKPFINSSGYQRIDIFQHGYRQSKLVHRLVAAAFLPVPAKPDMELHHKDFNKLNNSADNLEWLTKYQHRMKHKKGVDNVSTKPKDSIYNKIK